jgi:hypothetical protein
MIQMSQQFNLPFLRKAMHSTNIITQLARYQMDSDEQNINIIRKNKFDPQLPAINPYKSNQNY